MRGSEITGGLTGCKARQPIFASQDHGESSSELTLEDPVHLQEWLEAER